MSDYNIYLRRDGTLIDRFSQMVQDFRDDFEEEIVVLTLLNYHSIVSQSDPDEDLLWAIERVLQDFMTTDQYNGWMSARAYPKK